MLNQLAGTLRLEHRHADGSWSTLERRSHHDPADHDPERSWVKGQIYSCTTCDEQVRVSTPDAEPVTGPGGAA